MDVHAASEPGATRRLRGRELQLETLRDQLDAVRAGRGGTVLVVINPRREPTSFRLPFAGQAVRAGLAEVLASGVAVDGGEVTAAGFGYGLFRL